MLRQLNFNKMSDLLGEKLRIQKNENVVLNSGPLLKQERRAFKQKNWTSTLHKTNN